MFVNKTIQTNGKTKMRKPIVPQKFRSPLWFTKNSAVSVNKIEINQIDF